MLIPRPKPDRPMTRRHPLLIGALVAYASVSCWVHAAEGVDLQALSDIERFAIDGIDSGRALMNQNPQVVLDEFGLPSRIDVHHDRAFWDIDIEQTPAEWMYDGFSITAPYLRGADTSTGEWVPRSYQPARFIDEIAVFDSAVPVRLGLNVGVPASMVLEKLGIMSRAKPAVRIHRTVKTDHLIGRNVEITFSLDDTGHVTKIVWSRGSWH